MLNLTVTYGTIPCTRVNPTVSLSPSNPSTSAGNAVSYTVTVANKDSQGCSAATFSLSSSLPAAWPGGTYSPQQLTISPGGSATATFTKTPPAGTAVGTYAVNTEARNSSANVYGTAVASSTVITPHSISGQVTLNGAGLSGVTIALSGSQSASTVTNGNGNYSFLNLASGGNYTLTPSRVSYTFTPVNQTVSNLNGNQTASFTAALGPPGAPAGGSPTNGATLVVLTPVVSWSAGIGSTSHNVYFGTTSPPPFAANTTGTSYSPGALAGNTTYFWRIVAKNSAGTTSSGIWSFTTQLGTPAAPGGPSPVSGETNAPVLPTFVWQAAARATSYDVYFGTTATPGFAGTAVTNSFQPGAAQMKTGATYYWKVVAKNNAGTASSPVWSFTTGKNPSAPANLSPANLATGVSRGPKLQWSSATGATMYDVYFGVNSIPARVLTNTTQTSYTPSGSLASKTKYYWRVVAKSDTGQQSSETWSFTTVQ